MAALVDKKSVKRTIISMALPMLAGTFAMNAYNLTDTWFVSLLGTKPLAAMAFTFPVVLFLRSIVHGISTGSVTIISHAIGKKNHDYARSVTTHVILFALLLSFLLSIGGILSLDFIFRSLGATGDVLTMTKEYMSIWFVGVLFSVFPMINGSILISCGDTKSASALMVSGTVINTILDPILIFGFLFFPAMGIKGASLATVLSQVPSTLVGIHILKNKHKLIDFSQITSWNRILQSWKKVLYFGAPNSLSSLLQPLSAGVIIRIIATYGQASVAAIGAASRIETLAFMIPMTVGMTLVPFIGQNFGAERFDRIKEGMRFSYSFAIFFGLLITAVYYIFAESFAGLFTNDPEVKRVLIRYIQIISFGLGLMESHRYATFIFTGLQKPLFSALLNIIRVVVFLIPLSILGSKIFEIDGVFLGRLTTDIFAGCFGITLTTLFVKKQLLREKLLIR